VRFRAPLVGTGFEAVPPLELDLAAHWYWW
jgi:hypothetical protein